MEEGSGVRIWSSDFGSLIIGRQRQSEKQTLYKMNHSVIQFVQSLPKQHSRVVSSTRNIQHAIQRHCPRISSPSFSNPIPSHALLHRGPKIIGVKELGELSIHINDMDIPFISIANHSLGVLALLVSISINTQTPVNLQLKTDLIIHESSSRIISSINALQLQLLQPCLQV
jgi:hypothetical protein